MNKKPPGNANALIFEIENSYVEWDFEMRMLGHSPCHPFYVIDDLRILDFFGHQPGRLHLANRILTCFDVLNLVFLNFPESDVLDITPTAIAISPVFELI